MDRFTGLPALLGNRRLTLAGFSLAVVTILSMAAPFSANATTLRSSLSPTCDATVDSITGTGGSEQLITVIAATSKSTTASLELFSRVGGCWHQSAGPYRAFVGFNGLTANKREGDLATPMGLFAIQSTMYGVDPNPGVHFSYHHLICGDWWDEDSRSALYNHFVHVACGVSPHFSGDSEALWETVPQYDYLAVISYNRSPVVPGRGSAIFLHVSRGHPTTGCVSIPKVDLLHVLRTLQPGQHPLIEISTRQLVGH
ncbi:MAG TPA: L,D-transpeptidase family protein [Acidimicrobiales bacterium]